MDRDRAEVRLAEIVNALGNGLAELGTLLEKASERARSTRERLELQTWPTSEAALGIARQIIQQDIPALEECGKRAAGIAGGLRVEPAELAQIARAFREGADG